MPRRQFDPSEISTPTEKRLYKAAVEAAKAYVADDGENKFVSIGFNHAVQELYAELAKNERRIPTQDGVEEFLIALAEHDRAEANEQAAKDAADVEGETDLPLLPRDDFAKIFAVRGMPAPLWMAGYDYHPELISMLREIGLSPQVLPLDSAKLAETSDAVREGAVSPGVYVIPMEGFYLADHKTHAAVLELLDALRNARLPGVFCVVPGVRSLPSPILNRLIHLRVAK